jgi:hypothetical protein
MFHFPTFPPHTLYIQATVTGHNSSWVTPFGNPRINARLPTPQGLSQAPTSFIGSRCQGIHRMLLVACQTPQRHTLKKQDARVHYAVLKIRAETPSKTPAYQTKQPGSTRKRRPTLKTSENPPKGVARFLRTQQRATTRPHTLSTSFHAPNSKKRAVLDHQEKCSARSKVNVLLT